MIPEWVSRKSGYRNRAENQNDVMKLIQTLAGAAVCFLTTSTHAVDINLFEYAFNINGSVSNPTSGDAIPGGISFVGVSQAAFEGGALGTVRYSVTGAGTHHYSFFVDYDIDEADNTFFNEVGSTAGAPASGQTWEIDEPGFLFGDIYDHLLASDNVTGSALDNSIGEPDPEDVSMAMGWDFVLAAGETAVIDMTLTSTDPGGFRLIHTDPDSPASIYLSSVLRISGTQPPPNGVPDGGASLGLMLLGLGGLLAFKRRVC
jgi:hypothetical protein